ncbi:MAG: 50S ribosomal protein L13 [Candidatus Omnitrophota bacterium]
MKTYIPSEKDFDRKTFLINAKGKTLGRLATRVASILIGKGKAVISPDKLCGDQVIIINAKEIQVTGRKREQKVYTRFSGYADGLKTIRFDKLMALKPEAIVEKAIARMLPNTRLGREMLRRLRVYAGSEHRQQAQKPVPLEV